jgi:hypothetical protein
VPQPCSNPSKSPENKSKAFSEKDCDLQEFCNLQKSLANYLAGFARRRPGVRIPSAPLMKMGDLQAKRSTTMGATSVRSAFLQRPRSNPNSSPEMLGNIDTEI